MCAEPHNGVLREFVRLRRFRYHRDPVFYEEVDALSHGPQDLELNLFGVCRIFMGKPLNPEGLRVSSLQQAPHALNLEELAVLRAHRIFVPWN